MTLEEAAVAAGVSVRTLARYRKSGALEVVRVGRRVLCTLDAVERALVRRSAHQIGRELLDRSSDERPLRDWLQIMQRLAEATPGFEHPERHRAYVEEATRRHGTLPTQEYRVRHFRDIHETLASRQEQGEFANAILAFPDDTPVIEVLRQLNARFRW